MMRQQMRLELNEFSVDIFEDNQFNPSSADNPTAYDNYYGLSEFRPFVLNQYGIRTTDADGKHIRQVCISADGGKTRPHQHGCVATSNAIAICCGNTVFSLSIPDLSLQWQAQADSATCFEIFRHKDGFIVHGELVITRIDDDGNVVWQAGGPDIFVTPNGKDDFKIEGDVVYAASWYNGVLVLDANTGKVISHEQ